MFPEGMFKITMPIFKAWEEDGDVYIMGLGGDTEADDQGERLTEECIEHMKQQVQEGHISLIRGHWNEAGKVVTTGEWFDEIGQIVDILITPGGQMFPKILMDMEMPLARSLVKKIQRGKKLGLSYGGKPEQQHVEVLPDGRTVNVFDRMKLWHFVPTTRPVYSNNLSRPLEIVAKSIPSDEWERAAHIEVDSIDMNYEDSDKVMAIYKSWGEEYGNTDAGDKLKAEKWFQKHGAGTEGDLSDSDFAWLSFAYQKMSPEERETADKSANRKLPYKIGGKVYEDGWRAAWNAVHGARRATDFSGGPSQEAVMKKLMAEKPTAIEVTKSEKSEDVSVDGVSLNPIEHEDAYAVLKSVNPEIFESKGNKGMELTMEMLKEIVNSMLNTGIDSKLKSFQEANEAKLKSMVDSITDKLDAVLKAQKEDDKKGADDTKPALKSEDIQKMVDDGIKEKIGEMTKAALKSKKDGSDAPGDDNKTEKEQFEDDVVAVVKSEKSFEDFKDKGDDYVAKLKSQTDAITAELFHNIVGTDPNKVDDVKLK